MSIVNSSVFEGGTQRKMSPGDISNTNEVPSTNVTIGDSTLTVASLLSTILIRSGPTGAFSDTLPDANSIIAALMGQNAYLGSGSLTPLGVNAGITWRMRYINTVAYIGTIVTGTGVTLAGTTAVAASAIKDFLITVLNGTPQAVLAATTTNTSAVITGLNAAQTALLSPGMAVSGTGIPASTTVLSVQPGVGVTLSANATATGTLVALTFSPRIEFRAIGSMVA